MTKNPLHALRLVLFALVAATLAGAVRLSGQSSDWQAERIAGAGVAAFDSNRDRTVLWTGVETWEWDGQGLALAPALASPSPRTQVALAYDEARKRVVLFGGGAGSRLFDETWTYDGRAWTLQRPTVRPPARVGAAMTFDVARGTIVLFGGHDTAGSMGDTWEWNGQIWSLRRPVRSPEPRFDHRLVYDAARKRSLLFGGAGGTGDLWEWDGSAWVERQIAPSPGVLVGPAMTYDRARRRLVLFGGARAFGGVSAETWSYDGVRWSRLTPPAGPLPVEDATFVYDSRRQESILIAMPKIADARPVVVWSWDGLRWGRRFVQTLRPATIMQAAAYDRARSKTVVFGGMSNSNSSPRGTWEHGARAWSERNPAVSPSPRWMPAMAYDERRRSTLLFGGFETATNLDRDDTWLWNGSAWLQLTSPIRPPARMGHAMVYDRIRGRVVLFGGMSSERRVNLPGQTWEWNGRWVQRATAASPSPRANPAMAYDPVRGRVVLFGGRIGRAGVLGDTWEYDGNTWTQRVLATGPAPRAAAGMVYDEAARRIVLTGGTDGSWVPIAFRDTWAYDGQRWTRLPSAEVSAMPSLASVVYDSANATMLKVGETRRVWRFGLAASTTPIGSGCSGAGAAPRLAASLAHASNARFTVDLLGGRVTSPCMVGLSVARQDLALGSGCTLYLQSPVAFAATTTNGAGFGTIQAALPSLTALHGTSLHWQGFVLDARAPVLGLAFTGAIVTTIGL